MNRYLILGHVSISLLFALGLMKLRQHFGLPAFDWIVVLGIVFYWLGVFNARRNRAK